MRSFCNSKPVSIQSLVNLKTHFTFVLVLVLVIVIVLLLAFAFVLEHV